MDIFYSNFKGREWMRGVVAPVATDSEKPRMRDAPLAIAKLLESFRIDGWIDR